MYLEPTSFSQFLQRALHIILIQSPHWSTKHHSGLFNRKREGGRKVFTASCQWFKKVQWPLWRKVRCNEWGLRSLAECAQPCSLPDEPTPESAQGPQATLIFKAPQAKLGFLLGPRKRSQATPVTSGRSSFPHSQLLSRSLTR